MIYLALQTAALILGAYFIGTFVGGWLRKLVHFVLAQGREMGAATVAAGGAAASSSAASSGLARSLPPESGWDATEDKPEGFFQTLTEKTADLDDAPKQPDAETPSTDHRGLKSSSRKDAADKFITGLQSGESLVERVSAKQLKEKRPQATASAAVEAVASAAAGTASNDGVSMSDIVTDGPDEAETAGERKTKTVLKRKKNLLRRVLHAKDE